MSSEAPILNPPGGGSGLPASQLPPPEPPASPAPVRSRSRLRLAIASRKYAALYLLMFPTIISMVVFSYYPKIDVVFKSFYEWSPGRTNEFIGLKNFLDAFADPLFWQSFRLVIILLVANLVKMWPAIFTAVALHRLLSDRWRYIYQVLFVVPMVIPAIVWLLIWKSFYEPDAGILNRFLNGTGLMSVLAWLDGSKVGKITEPGVMPQIAAALDPVMHYVAQPLFGGVWGMLVLGAMVLSLRNTERGDGRLTQYGLLAALSALTAMIGLAGALAGEAGVLVNLVLLAVGLWMLAQRIGAHWILWPFWLVAGLWAFSNELWRLPVTVLLAVGLTELCHYKFHRLTAPVVLQWIGTGLLIAGGLLILFGKVWTEPTLQFYQGTPAWLGNADLIIPAIIFWGFPWVGTVGVLIYLAGLQQISTDVYEAAHLDGVGPIGMLFRIELPLIMTQVRINLIFMTIATLTGYETFFILLGEDGGPDNKGMVPGLYMFSQAFSDNRYGYACALGMVLFVMILLLTIIYQRYVKVDK